MSSAAQIAANIANSQSSTGPRSETGKAKSAKNAVTFGLFSGDFIRPGEEEGYAILKTALFEELAPASLLEDVLVDEIHRATWRLRRCGQVESRLMLRLNDGENFILDPMETHSADVERIQKSVDRARSQAHRIIHKCTAELRRLQTERKAAMESEKIPMTRQSQPAQSATPRSAPCPCGSGQKHKRCCGKEAPPVLQAVPQAA